MDQPLRRQGWPEWLRFDALKPAPRIAAPTLMVHSREAAFPYNVERFAAALGGPQQAVWCRGSQLDFYDEPTQVDPAVAMVADHFHRTLQD